MTSVQQTTARSQAFTASMDKFNEDAGVAGSDKKRSIKDTSAIQVMEIEAALILALEETKNGAKADLYGVIKKIQNNNAEKKDLRDEIDNMNEALAKMPKGDDSPDATEAQKGEASAYNVAKERIKAKENDLSSLTDLGDELRTMMQLNLQNFDNATKAQSNASKKFDGMASTQLGNIK